MMPIVAASAASPQGGFIRNRYFSFTNNVVLIDTVCRIYSDFADRYGSAIAAFFDFPNAFHQFYFSVFFGSWMVWDSLWPL